MHDESRGFHPGRPLVIPAGGIETREVTDLPESAGVYPVFLYLVIHEALGCTEKFGCMALIAFRTPERFHDQIPFIGIDTRLQIDVCSYLFFWFHGLPPFRSGVGHWAPGIRNKIFSSYCLMPGA